ncbi:hypothetical protein O9929_02595 [Vibrio lentus]|nr:hypothetical protein [Vibrio lentus]
MEGQPSHKLVRIRYFSSIVRHRGGIAADGKPEMAVAYCYRSPTLIQNWLLKRITPSSASNTPLSA